jgi:hypothetical protein
VLKDAHLSTGHISRGKKTLARNSTHFANYQHCKWGETILRTELLNRPEEVADAWTYNTGKVSHDVVGENLATHRSVRKKAPNLRCALFTFHVTSKFLGTPRLSWTERISQDSGIPLM